MKPTLAAILESDQEMGLVVQGGGMRGSYSISVLHELARSGYTKRFSKIWATSAGAVNGAYFLAGQTEAGLTAYTEHLARREFINPLRRSCIIDIDYLIDKVLTEDVVLDLDALRASQSQLNLGVMAAVSGQLHWADIKNMAWPLLETFRAATALPVVYGKEILLGDQAYVDGGLIEALPVSLALESGLENVLVVMTKPLDHQVKAPSRAERRAMRYLAERSGHSAGVINQLGSFDFMFQYSLTTVRRGTSSNGRTNIWCVAPTGAMAGRLTRDPRKLQKTIDLAARDTRAALLA